MVTTMNIWLRFWKDGGHGSKQPNMTFGWKQEKNSLPDVLLTHPLMLYNNIPLLPPSVVLDKSHNFNSHYMALALEL